MFDVHEEARKVPDRPGVYMMKDENGDIIYVGKASSLKNRVRQYFLPSAGHLPKVQVMVSKIREFDYIITDSEEEALILECNLIKKYRPRYNVLLKDDKNYPYIKVTLNEEYPRIFMTRRVEKDGARYFGPYSNAGAVRDTIDLIKKLFPMKTCRRILPRDIGKGRPCLNYYIYQCLGPCRGEVNKEEYREAVRDICSFLGGRHEEIVKKLEKQMEDASNNLDFEKAAALRDKISSLKVISGKQKVLSNSTEDQDVVAFAREDDDACIQVFFIRGGKLIGKQHFIFEKIAGTDNKELLTCFVKQFYDSVDNIPSSIIIQEEIDEISLIEKWLSNKKLARVSIKVPKKGEKKKLVEMVAQNALIALKQLEEKQTAQARVSKEGQTGLALLLGLEKPLHRIEAYDISNTGSTDMVGSMVVFEEGAPARKEYRRFRIKTVDVQNDYASMQEMVFRRFKRAIECEGNGIPSHSFARLPDLILVDGGKGHVNAVREVCEEFKSCIPVYGMVKDDKHKVSGLVGPEKEIDISVNTAVLRLVSAISSEAHRFAIEYNKKIRKKRYTNSELDEIEGIGPKKKKALIKHFGSIKEIREAGLDDLAGVEGISRNLAERIYSYFRK